MHQAIPSVENTRQSKDYPSDCAVGEGQRAGARGLINCRVVHKEPSSATRTSGLRVFTPALPNNRCTIFFTELSERPILAPIFLFVRPPRMPRRTLRSRSSSTTVDPG